jgi:hypothetical protein
MSRADLGCDRTSLLFRLWADRALAIGVSTVRPCGRSGHPIRPRPRAGGFFSANGGLALPPRVRARQRGAHGAPKRNSRNELVARGLRLRWSARVGCKLHPFRPAFAWFETMPQTRAYVFRFFTIRSGAEPAFSRDLWFPDDAAAIAEGATLLEAQQVLAEPASAVAVCREEGGVAKPLGRWIWAGESCWAPEL